MLSGLHICIYECVDSNQTFIRQVCEPYHENCVIKCSHRCDDNVNGTHKCQSLLKSIKCAPSGVPGDSLCFYGSDENAKMMRSFVCPLTHHGMELSCSHSIRDYDYAIFRKKNISCTNIRKGIYGYNVCVYDCGDENSNIISDYMCPGSYSHEGKTCSLECHEECTNQCHDVQKNIKCYRMRKQVFVLYILFPIICILLCGMLVVPVADKIYTGCFEKCFKKCFKKCSKNMNRREIEIELDNYSAGDMIPPAPPSTPVNDA